MEDSFKLRVARVFGSLAESTTSAPWTLSDEKLERKEWKRDETNPEREGIQCSPTFKGFFSKEDDDIDGDADNGRSEGFRTNMKRSEVEDEEESEVRDIRSSIGLDATLDNEEEEDQYDKVAVGREHDGDRLYMWNATDYGPYAYSGFVLPNSSKEINSVDRDPRANHIAARVRIKEDNGAAKILKSTVDPDIKPTEVKPILKSKENHIELKSKKRVRFDPGCLENPSDDQEDDKLKETIESSLDENVPDYVRNPSKYIQYTLDGSNENDTELNSRAYMDFCDRIETSVSDEPESATILPKSLIFTPRKKVMETRDTNNTKVENWDENPDTAHVTKVSSVGIACGDPLESEACAMEEDNLLSSMVGERNALSRKPNHQYRSKTMTD